LWIIYFILDTKISEASVFKQVYSSTCSTKELSISMTKILHAVKGRIINWQNIINIPGSEIKGLSLSTFFCLCDKFQTHRSIEKPAK
jgi:hypothetical protein